MLARRCRPRPPRARPAAACPRPGHLSPGWADRPRTSPVSGEPRPMTDRRRPANPHPTKRWCRLARGTSPGSRQGGTSAPTTAPSAMGSHGVSPGRTCSGSTPSGDHSSEGPGADGAASRAAGDGHAWRRRGRSAYRSGAWPSGPDPPTRPAAAGHRRDQPQSPRLRSRPFARVGGGYLEYHRQRYQDTLRLLPPGESASPRRRARSQATSRPLARRAAGWEVIGLNNDDRGGRRTGTDFLERCGERDSHHPRLRGRARPFPLPTGSVDGVLFCELFEHST